MVEQKETCLKINGKQTVKSRSGSVKFKNYFKELAVPFKIYADFESLKELGVVIKNKYFQNNSLQFCLQSCCVDDKFSRSVYLRFMLILNLLRS